MSGPQLNFTTANVTHPEGNSGETDYVFNVARTGSLEAGSSVRWYSGGVAPDAVDTADFRAGEYGSQGSLSFAPGEASKTITFHVTGDTNLEPDEKFYVLLQYAQNADIGQSDVAYGIIQNDDGVSGGGSGVVLTGRDVESDTLTGGSGNDTLNAGHNNDTLIGNGGADRFAFQYMPWNAGHITDFTPGNDLLDLRALFHQAGYTGTDPYGDGRLSFVSDGMGDTKVYFDADGPSSPQYPILITTLDHISPNQLSPSDWVFQWPG